MQRAGGHVARLAWSSPAVHLVRCALPQSLMRSMPVVPSGPSSQLRLQRANRTMKEEVPHVLGLERTPSPLDERDGPLPSDGPVASEDAVPRKEALHQPAAEHGILVGDEPAGSAVASDRVAQQSDRERTARCPA